MNPFATSSKQIRDAAKWLIAAFAAISTVFLAGTQFSSIGSLPWGWRAAAAMVAAAVTVSGLVVVIWILLDVLLVSQVTLADLARQEQEGKESELVAYIKRNPASLQGFRSVGRLSSTYLQALRSARRKSLAYYEALRDRSRPSTLKAAEEDAQAAADRLSYLRSSVSYLVSLMAYQQLQGRLAGRRRAVVFAGAVLVAVGLGVFAWAVNPPAKQKGVVTPGAALRGARLVDARLTGAKLFGPDLRGADLRGAKVLDAHLEGAILVAANLSGADFTNSVLRGADLRNATIAGATWSNTICPEGTNSDTHRDGCASRRGPK